MLRALIGRVFSVLLRTLGIAILASVALLLLLVFVLWLPASRAVLLRQGLSFANQSLPDYSISLASLDSLSPFSLELHGLRVLDKQQREMVRVDALSLALVPTALLQKRLHIAQFRAEGVRVHLYPDDATEASSESDFSTDYTLQVDDLGLRDVEFETQLAGRALFLQLLSLRAHGNFSAKPALALLELELRAELDRREVLHIAQGTAAFRADVGGRLALTGTLAEEAALSLSAEIPELSDLTPWPVHNASLTLQGLTRAGFERLGLEGGLGLKPSLALEAHVQREGAGANGELRSRLGLWLDGEKVALEGRLSAASAELSVVLPKLGLAALSADFPDLAVQGAVQVTADLARVPQAGSLVWRAVRIDGAVVPDGTLRVELPWPLVKLTGLKLKGFEQALSAQAQYDTQRGNVQTALDLRDFPLGSVGVLAKLGLSGTLDGSVQASVHEQRIKGTGALTLRDAVFPNGHIESAQLGLKLSGTTRVPEGQVTLTAANVRLSDLPLDHVALQAHASAKELAGQLELRGAQTALTAHVTGTRKADGSVRASASGHGTLRDKRVQFVLRDFESNPSGLSVAELSLIDGVQRVWAKGQLGKNQRVNAELVLDRVAIESWAGLAGVEHLSGTVNATGRIEGKLAQPSFEVRLAASALRYQENPALEGTLLFSGDLTQGHLALDVLLGAPSVLDARAQIQLTLPERERNLQRALAGARYAAELELRGDLAPFLSMLEEPISTLKGTADVFAQAEGTLLEPHAQLRSNFVLYAPGSESPDTLELSAVVEPEHGKVDVAVHDSKGVLARLGLEVPWSEDKLRSLLIEPARWEKLPFSSQAELKSRDLEAMSGVAAYMLGLYAPALPLTAQAQAQAAGELSEITGTLSLQLAVRDDGLDARCTAGRTTAIHLDIGLVPDALSLLIELDSAHAGQMRLEADAKLTGPLLWEQARAVGKASVSARSESLQLTAVPGLCGLAQGSGRFELTGEELFSAVPRVRASLALNEVSVPDAQPLNVTAKFSNDAVSASLEGRLTGQNQASGTFSARVPLRYDAYGVPEVLQSNALAARLNFKNLPLENLLALTPAIGRPSGMLDANLTLSGTAKDPVPGGLVEVRDASFTVASLAQPFRDVRGRFELKGRKVTIDNLVAKDRNGEVKLDGYASLFTNGRGDMKLNVDAKKFPVRQQGSVVGELTTRLALSGKLSDNKEASLVARILEGRIWLTGERGADVQSLDPHPHVRMAEDLAPAIDAEVPAAQDSSYVLRSFTLKSEKDLWLMHEDFSVQVGVALELTQEKAGPKLEGEASLRRGELALLGKPFRLERGAIRFTGDIPADPELDLKARHDLRTGEALLVHVTGRASAPQLNFSGAATNAGEAAYVLSGARSKTNANNQAQNDAAAFAASVTAGLLSVAARREFGDWVPMISIENDERTGSPGRARAGFDASNLIPSWLSGFARGAYVEGIVGGSDPSGTKRMGLGVRLELALPRDFITSMGYGPGATWSTDVAWAP